MALTAPEASGHQNWSMKPPSDKRYQPICPLCHGVLDKLSAIIGYCDLLSQRVVSPTDCSKDVGSIRDIARQLAQELATFQCELLEASRQAETQEILPYRA
jgi:hypothetical protein